MCTASSSASVFVGWVHNIVNHVPISTKATASLASTLVQQYRQQHLPAPLTFNHLDNAAHQCHHKLQASSCTRRMNWILTTKLRGWCAELRSAAPGDRPAMKAAFLKEFLQALLVSLGPPPAAFDWTFTDKDGAYKTFSGMQACRDNRFTFAQTYSHVWET